MNLTSKINLGFRTNLTSKINLGLRTNLTSKINLGLRTDLMSKINLGLRTNLMSKINLGLRTNLTSKINLGFRTNLMKRLSISWHRKQDLLFTGWIKQYKVLYPISIYIRLRFYLQLVSGGLCRFGNQIIHHAMIALILQFETH
jgi:hypothetical protein